MATKPPSVRPLGWVPRFERERRRKAAIDLKRGTPAQRGYDSDWRALRDEFLRDPSQQDGRKRCSAPGCCEVATDVDHIKSVRDFPWLRLVWENLRAFCHRHHSQRTARDQGFAKKPDRF